MTDWRSETPKRKTTELRLHGPQGQRLTLARVAETTAQCEIQASLVTRTFRGERTARIDGNQWSAFVHRFERVARGDGRCAELETARAGLSLQICGHENPDLAALVCRMHHPSFLGADTAIYETSAQFTATKAALSAWLHHAVNPGPEE